MKEKKDKTGAVNSIVDDKRPLPLKILLSPIKSATKEFLGSL